MILKFIVGHCLFISLILSAVGNNELDGSKKTPTADSSGNETITTNNPIPPPSTAGNETNDNPPSLNTTIAPDIADVTTLESSNSSTPHPIIDDSLYADVTTFSSSINAWDFRGHWMKYNISQFSSMMKIPNLEASEDHIVLINKVNNYVSVLRKVFPPVLNGSISITHFISYSDDIFIVGIIVNPVDNYQETFLNSTEKRWSTRNQYWITETFEFGSHEKPFEIIFKAKTSTTALWGIDIITVRGIGNDTETEYPDIPPAVVPPSWHQDNKTDAPSPGEPTTPESYEDETNELWSVASAIWQGFYVLLALFCALLVVLIVVVVIQQKKKYYPESSVAAYTPRTPYYTGKQDGRNQPAAQDNPGYQTDPV